MIDGILMGIGMAWGLFGGVLAIWFVLDRIDWLLRRFNGS